MDASRYVLVGSGGHALTVSRTANSGGIFIIGYLDNDANACDIGLPWLGTDIEFAQLLNDGCTGFIFGIGSIDAATAKRRAEIFERLADIGGEPPVIAHPTANISASAVLGLSTIAMRGCVVGEDVSVGINAILNTGCIIDHHCVIGNHSHIAPGVTISGSVFIGNRALVGSGSTVIQGVSIGDGAVVAAGSVVVADVAPYSSVGGCPAKELK